jgi:hypothetical protein
MGYCERIAQKIINIKGELPMSEHPFVILQKYVSENMADYMKDNNLKYYLSPKLKELKIGAIAVTGGKVTQLINDILSPGNYILTLDDGLGEIKLYLIGVIYNEFKEMIAPNNVLLAKGYISTRHISGVNFLVVTSLSLIVPAKEGIVQ